MAARGGAKSLISIDIDPASLKRLEQLRKKLPEKANKAMEITCGRVAADLRNALVGALGDEGWTGYLYNSIEPKQTEDGWGVRMLRYGQELDNGGTRTLELIPGHKITTWAAAHEIIASPYADTGRSITVREHPFIQTGLQNVTNHANNAMDEVFQETL